MTRQNDIVDEIQLPCSKILVRFGSRIYNVQKVMDSLLIKFQPGSPSHFYVIATLSDLATCNPTHIVPYLKAILGTMLANIKTTKKDNLRWGLNSIIGTLFFPLINYERSGLFFDIKDRLSRNIFESFFKEIRS